LAIDAGLQPIERGDERLRHVAPAERTESAARVGIYVVHDVREQRLRFSLIDDLIHQFSSSVRYAGVGASRATRINASIFAGSFTPGARSTPLLTSTPNGRTVAIASATFTAFNPPASTSCVRAASRCAVAQSAVVPDPLTFPSYRRRDGSDSAISPSRTTASTVNSFGMRSAARSLKSVCTMSGRNVEHTSSTSRCGGWR